jgi:hypothetical protein
MNTSTKIGLAVAGGYLLGRRRKAKMALMLGSVLLGKRLDLRSLGREAASRLAASPEVGKVREEISGQLASTGRAAATAALSAPINRLADRLHERTSALSGDAEERSGGDAEAGQKGSEPDDESDDSEGPRRDREGTRDADDERARHRRPATDRMRGRETARAPRQRTGGRRSTAGTGGRTRG